MDVDGGQPGVLVVLDDDDESRLVDQVPTEASTSRRYFPSNADDMDPARTVVCDLFVVRGHTGAASFE